ncbi:MAG: hypothetical protein ACK40O_05960 [Allosphingosinicella sp.]
MIARGFKSVAWVGAVGSAALGCYMISLQVATERAELARVEAAIIAAKQDIRSLQTELGTRGRLSQLEHWNAEVLALSAPSSQQLVDDAFTLARLDQTEPTVGDRAAQVQLASAEAAPAPAARPAAPVVQVAAPAPVQPALVHRASFTATPAPAPLRAAAKPEKPKPEAPKLETARAEKAKPEAPKAEAAKPEPRKPARLDGLKAEIAAARAAADGGDGN